MATGRHRLHLTAGQRTALILLAAVLALGAPALALYSTTSPAQAAVPTGNDYPWQSMPCEHAPYSTAAVRCASYDWGPVRNGSEASTYSLYRYGYRNCTDFVAWRLDKVNGFHVGSNYGDASTWGTVNSRITNRTPAAGSVAWFQGSDHVAWVEAVSGSNVIIQDYNHALTGAFARYSVPISQVTGFIHFKDLGQGGGGGTTQQPPPVVFGVMNTSEQPPDGVYFRSAPQTAAAVRITGFGVYRNDQVQLRCYGWGDAVGPYADRLWYQVSNLTRPTVAGRADAGWLNAHYINDSKNANVGDAGVPAC